MTETPKIDVEKYKVELLDFHLRNKARQESSGWRDTLSLFMLFPIMIFSLYFFVPLTAGLRVEDVSGWMLILACFGYSVVVALIWMPFFAWGLRNQTEKAKEIYNKLRFEYGLEPKEY